MDTSFVLEYLLLKFVMHIIRMPHNVESMDMVHVKPYGSLKDNNRADLWGCAQCLTSNNEGGWPNATFP